MCHDYGDEVLKPSNGWVNGWPKTKSRGYGFLTLVLGAVCALLAAFKR